MTNLQEELLKSQLGNLTNTKNLGDFIKKLAIIIKAAKPLLKREGYEVEVFDMKYDGRVWSAILLREQK